jgi:hypothetical protein
VAKHTWRKVRGWHSHSLACWDSEWESYKLGAQLADQSVNGWIRTWLTQAVAYEKLEAKEKDDLGR